MRDQAVFRPVLAVIALSIAALAGTGCSPRSSAPDVIDAPVQESSPTPSTTEPAAPAPLSDLRVSLEVVAKGFELPLFVTHAGDGSGRLFVVEQGGLVRVIRDGRVGRQPYLDVQAQVKSGGEQGLLGLAFDPDFESNGHFYVNYTDRGGYTNVVRYTAEDPASDSPELSGRRVLLKIEQPYTNHNGGCLAFAPDGTLWVGMGDGGSAGDPQGRAQDPDELLGKMLSLDVSEDRQPTPRIVMSGLRNPWRFSFDRATDDVWIADVGQGEWEEIDVVGFAEARGRDFGWNLWEGNHPYPPGASRSRTGFTFPVIEYGHGQGSSVTGGYVYRGTDYPVMAGTYFYADFGSGFIAGAQVTDGGRVQQRVLIKESGMNPSSFGEDEDGEMYLCDYGGGRILRLTATADSAPADSEGD